MLKDKDQSSKREREKYSVGSLVSLASMLAAFFFFLYVPTIILVRSYQFGISDLKGMNIASKLVQNNVTHVRSYEFVQSFAQFSCFNRLGCFALKGTPPPFKGVLRTYVCA